ncbi:Crp/Fnr family transcriptional regulator [Nemorincola caseinilytica]|uniref:Crp/Fnr family transcriptional regulator n=1 Tax=Nemorincola caseinilytica TaxID=2054315 RepID=A0ABP8N620_9BACT
MFSKFFEELKARGPLDKDKWDEYVSHYNRIEVPAKAVLLKEGEISKRAYIVEQGCMRVWFNNNGKDITYHFVFENEVVTSAESFIKNVPSLFTIETIEPCVVHWIHKHDLDRILGEMHEIPEVRKAYLDAIIERQFHYMKQFLSFIKDTPTQRYLNLIEENPQIIKRVPQHYIASYLGITPVSLSRIRSKVKLYQ